MDDELVALEAIYSDSFSFDPDADSYRIVINELWTLVFWADRELYPSATSPDYTVELAKDVAWKSRDSSNLLHHQLAALFSPGEVCIMQWIEHLANNSNDYIQQAQSASEVSNKTTVIPTKHQLANRNIKVHSGEVLVDRKSRFQAHIAVATCLEDVEWVVQEIKNNGKVTSATHVMVAYRFKSGDSNRDDDGEGGAGDRMLDLLRKMQKTDIVGVVVRWYGGIPLGPDRFKDITGVLKKLIESTETF